MKRKSIVALITLVAALYPAFGQIHISTSGMSLLLDAEKGCNLKILYFGDRLSSSDAENIMFSGTADRNAYPPYGLDCPSEAALAVIHSDGSLATELKVEDTSTADNGNSSVTKIRLKDRLRAIGAPCARRQEQQQGKNTLP